ncbi:MAG: site-specific integrase [Phycisphaerae bacterium]|nr:site-specific integrase [Phycisphaerae bacterium]
MRNKVHVSVRKPANRDGSYTLYHRWIDPATGREVREVCLRTKPKCSNRDLAKAVGLARQQASALSWAMHEPTRPSPAIEWTYLARGLKDYLAWSSQLGGDGVRPANPTTLTAHERHIRDFIDWMKGAKPRIRAMNEVIQTHVAHWRDHLLNERGLKAGTINTMLASLSRWFTWAIDYGHVYTHVVHGVLRLPEESVRPTLVIEQPEDLIRLMDHMADRLRADTALVLATTGMRCGEFRGLRRSDWDRAARLVIVPDAGSETTKRHGRVIPLPEQGQRALEHLTDLGDGPWLVGPDAGRQPYSSQINRWLKGYMGLRPHDLRRFYIHALETVGTPQRVINDLVGHSPAAARSAEDSPGASRGHYTPISNPDEAWPWVLRFQEWLG